VMRHRRIPVIRTDPEWASVMLGKTLLGHW
jgi:hypothetical protein